jgi:hypothetical protein
MRILPALLLISTLIAADAGPCWADEAPRLGSNRFVMSASATSNQRRFAQLISVRAEAIDHALGRILEGACSEIYIEFARPSDASYPRNDAVAYDAHRHTLTFRHSLLNSLDYEVTSWAKSYWPYYQSETASALLPAIEIIDDALWMTHLQEAAHRKGTRWPHPGCSSLDIAKRLGCEMLVAGVHASRRMPTMFNTNRVDILWPENLRELRSRAWRHGDTEYRDVQRLGGLLLMRSLVAQFGVSRVLQYVAQTPFDIQGENVRASALHYQEQARQALSADAIN